MRLVSKVIDSTLTSAPNTPVNFGLFFNKFLKYQLDNHGVLKPVVTQDRKPLINDYQKSIEQAANILKQRHLQQADYCQEMEKAGWHHFIVHARLTAPFVSGLGMAHPTETGLVLDHTSGMPYIPASSQKGVLRLAHLVNTLCDEQGRWLPENELEEKGIIKRNKKNGEWEWQEEADEAGKTLFGFSGDQKALAGQLIILDAYPLIPPELGEEILNPHYGDYYQKKTDRNGRQRGPSEDQSPVPIKFLVVRQGAEFVFRVLLRTPFAGAPYPPENRKALITLVERNLHSALTNEGMGAKTALGFGRFAVISQGEPEQIGQWWSEQKEQEEKERLANDPVAQRQQKLDFFVQQLPTAAQLPSLAGALLQQVEGFDEILQKDCLLKFRARYKEQIKKARKKNKKWASDFDELSRKLGL